MHKCLHEQGCAVEFRVHHEDSHGTVKCYSNRLTHDCGRSSQGERVCPSTGAVLRVARPPLHATMDMWLMEDEETAWPEPPENDSPGSSSSTSHQASACAILPLRAGQMTHTHPHHPKNVHTILLQKMMIWISFRELLIWMRKGSETCEKNRRMQTMKSRPNAAVSHANSDLRPHIYHAWRCPMVMLWRKHLQSEPPGGF